MAGADGSELLPWLGRAMLRSSCQIMAFITMAFWLGLVFYADSHPGYGHGKTGRRPQKAAPQATATQLPAVLSASADATGATAQSRELEPAGGRS